MKTHASQQILDLGRYNFLPVAPMVMILVFFKSQCRELSKTVYFYPILTYSFQVMILSSKTCRDTPNLSLSSEPIRVPIQQASDFSRLSLSEEYNWNVAQVWNIVSSELTSDVRKSASAAYADSLIPILISSFSHI